MASAKLVPSPSPKPAYSWSESARRFTGESQLVRENEIKNLRRYPNLNAELKRALGSSEHFLALDVISALRLRELFSDLLVFSERDHTGYSYHVINSLFEKQDEDRVRALYLQRLDSSKTSPASKMAILDALARMGITLGNERVERLLRDESPEVRSATLSVIRSELVFRNVQRNLPYLEKTIEDPIFQIRIQTLYLVSELPASFRRANLNRVSALFERCSKDPMPQVKAICEAVRKGAVE